MGDVVIKVSNLTKAFSRFKAVDDISFTVNNGEIYGFLGQNGAGKSTTIRMLLTLVAPVSGTIEIFGLDLSKHRKEILKNIGAIIERPDLYDYLSAYDNLSLFSRLSGHSVSRNKLMDQLELVGLKDRSNDKVKTFSQGMKQRLGIAVALVHNPQLVILDEPTNGLDPQGIADVRNLILHLSRHERRTVFVSSHLLSEMQVLADRMLILDKGKAVKEGSIRELMDPSTMVVHIEVSNPDMVVEKLKASIWSPAFVSIELGVLQFRLASASIPLLVEFLITSGALILSVVPRHSLEQYFLSLTTDTRHVDTFKN